MNILVLSWRDPKHPLAGGAEQVMHEHMKGWVSAGHNVTLFSSRIRELPSSEALDEIKIIRRGDQYFGVKVAAFIYYLRNINNYDFVVDQFHGIPFFTPLYVSKPKLAVLQEITKEVWFLYHLVPFPLNFLLGAIGYISEPVIFLLYGKIPFMVGSNSAREDLVKMRIPSKNIHVVPHGVMTVKLDAIPKKEKVKTILFLGALAKDKGVEDAVQTFAILNCIGSYNFWIVGRGDEKYKNKLEKMAKESCVDIKFWGFVSDRKKFELLSRSDLLINPSAREGWGLVNIEANSVGIPVVSYNSAGLIDSVYDGVSGVIVKSNNPKELAKSVRSVLEDANLYERLKKGAVSWSKKFSWEESKEKSIKLITSLMRV